MPIRDTIAIVASDDEKALEVADAVWLNNQRVLLVAKYPGQMMQALQTIQDEYPLAEVEVMDCMKEGCWEADLILLNIEEEDVVPVASLIREVAVQKPVVRLIWDSDATAKMIRLQQLMTHAKVVVALQMNRTCNFQLTGDDPDTLRGIQTILKCKSGDANGVSGGR